MPIKRYITVFINFLFFFLFFLIARLTIKQFGIRKNEKIACYVTVRGKKAEELLEAGLKVKEYEVCK